MGADDDRARSRGRGSGCCCRARRSARTTRRSRGSTYDEEGVSRADYDYGYTQALVDGVCRPVTFHTYGGDMEWVSDGRVRRADFDVVLPAAGGRAAAAHRAGPGGRLDHPRPARRRRGAARASAPATHPDAGGLVVAIDKEHAEKLADRLARITGERPDIVHSDAADASARIARFSAGSAPWLVSVLMVSEGVDVPRLRVGVYATTARTELFFRQVIGRFIRRTPAPKAADVARLPAVGPAPEEARGRDRGGAQPRAGPRAGRASRWPSAASGPRRARRSGRCGRAPAATTTCCRRPSPATRCSCSPSRRRRPPRPRWRRSRRRRRPRSRAVEPETAFEKRERLRAERSALVGDDRPPHRRGAPRRSTRA